MRAIRQLVPALLVAAYGFFYAWSWYFFTQVERVNANFGHEYIAVILATLPWCILGAPVAASLPASAFHVFTTACALINATLLWRASRRLLRPQRTPKRGRR